MEVPPPPPARRGRPRDPERLRRVLEAAAEHFQRDGFAGTSMDAVAARSGVSKMTIYNYFPSKEQLFEACIAARIDAVFAFDTLARFDLREPAHLLRHLGRSFLRLMRDPEVLGMHRTLYAAAGQHPGACASFYAQGPRRLTDQLAQALRAMHAAGSLQVPDPARAADQFYALFLGRDHCAALLGLPLPGDAADAATVEAHVAMFLRAHAPTKA